MKNLFVLTALTIGIAGCSANGTSTPGADADEHGCRASAGYSWCASSATCERPWELAEREGFENTAEAFAEYCGN